jgi:hypothetical protein
MESGNFMKVYRSIAAGLALALVAGAVSAQPTPRPGAAMRQACMADFQKVCPDAKPGPGGGLRDCIVAHFADLSAPCKDAIMTMRAARRAQQQQGGGTPPPAGAGQ